MQVTIYKKYKRLTSGLVQSCALSLLGLISKKFYKTLEHILGYLNYRKVIEIDTKDDGKNYVQNGTSG